MSVFRRFQNCDSASCIRMKIDWKDVVKLTLIEEANAWDVQVTEEEIERQAKLLCIDKHDYHNNLKKYLINTPQNVSIVIRDNCLFVYRSLEELRVTYFTIALNKLNYVRCVEQLLDDYNESSLLLTDNLKTAENERLKAESDKMAYEKKLEEFVALKETNDSRMVSDFLLLLNEKKKRIQHLNDLVKFYKSSRTTVALPEVGNVKKLKTGVECGNHGASLQLLSGSDSSRETTDDDDDGDNGRTAKIIGDELLKSPVPGTSKDNFNIIFDDDSPPPAFIPKRVKPDNTNYSNSEVENTGNNEEDAFDADTQELLPNITNKPFKNNSQVEVPHEEENSTPELDFNTQDLLDRM